jgi:hypothetical protein
MNIVYIAYMNAISFPKGKEKSPFGGGFRGRFTKVIMANMILNPRTSPPLLFC